MNKNFKKKYKKEGNNNLLGIILILFVFMIFAGIFFFYFKANRVKEDINPLNYCLINGNESITALLIDKTDKLNVIQQESLKNELFKIRDGIPKNGKLEVYLIGNTKEDILKPVLSICNPGNSSNANKYTENPRKIKLKWEKFFKNPFDKMLETLSQNESAKESPILESIQSIAVSTFNHPNNLNAKTRRFIIASDMLHYTSELSLYRPKYDLESEEHQKYLRKIHSDLRNVDVEILMLKRMDGVNNQGKNLISFWNNFFDAQNASLIRVYAISG